MKQFPQMTCNIRRQTAKAAVLAVIICCALAGSTLAQFTITPGVLPPGSTPHGNSYGQWSAEWWQWGLMFHPMQGVDPLLPGEIDCTAGQTGNVWFLATPFGTNERTCTIPTGMALFVGTLNAECSSLEGLGTTEEEQRQCAINFANDISDLFFTIDGVAVKDLADYRVVSPQFTFEAPSPWIFGDTGGTGTSVSDGYFLMLAPLSEGEHTLHYGGSFPDFGLSADMTYHLIVTGHGR